MDKLSKLQKDILTIALDITESKDFWKGWHNEAWGVEVSAIRRRLKKYFEPWTRSRSAAFSRAMVRLEERGLIDRVNFVSNQNRTTSIRLTESGITQAKKIQGQK